jgi:hypothetical protein
MSANEAQSIVAWWGAVLSTLLAIVKLWELWRDRFRLEIGYNFTGKEEEGNTIIVRNLSGKPVILSWWEVLYVSGRWPRRKFEDAAYPDYDAGDERIEPHSSLQLHFVENNHFAWGHKALKGAEDIHSPAYCGAKAYP